MVEFSKVLRSYFHSGWVFFIPYLALYLLYAHLGWPTNPGGTGEWPHVPSLLHLYRSLHIAHLVLAVVAMSGWWHGLGNDCTARRSRKSDAVLPLLPWLFLALIFWIPRIYLEWPADPWEHLRRINEWHAHDIVTAHSTWQKSGYFLPYSLTGHTTGLVQLDWLNAYNVGICLLLCWQNYRLARAMDLSERAAFVYVLLNAVLFGNNIFSFFRYYGLASTIFAQIGAIALTRITLEAVRTTVMARRAAAQWPQISLLPYSLLRWTAAAFALVQWIAFNHMQGLGIAGMGIMAVIAWRLCEWRRELAIWLVGIAAVLSVAVVLWLPRHPAVDQIFRAQGWLTSWYGFNFLSIDSPSVERSLHILGTWGLFSLVAALWIIVRRNHVSGWLTLMPIVVLALPCFALPFTHALATFKSVENIVTFHRMLLAIPIGLALVTAFSDVRSLFVHSTPGVGCRPSMPLAASLLLPTLFCGLIIPPSRPFFNRFWHSLQVAPEDLQLKHFHAITSIGNPAALRQYDAQVITTPLANNVWETFSPAGHEPYRRIDPVFVPDDINARSLVLRRALPYYASTRNAAATQPAVEFPNDPVLVGREPAMQKTRLLAAPFLRNTPWTTLGEQPPKRSITANRVVLHNPTGSPSYAFTRELIPVSLDRRYSITATIRNKTGAEAVNYLAVAWYDKEGNLLISNEPPPHGAGKPYGWSNGIYSYFGLVGQPAPSVATSYSTTFGFGEILPVPAHATHIRIGALLNERAAPEAEVELIDLELYELPPHQHLLVFVPNSRQCLTPGSQAALLSRHWASQQVSVECAGTEDLRAQLAGFPRFSSVKNKAQPEHFK